MNATTNNARAPANPIKLRSADEFTSILPIRNDNPTRTPANIANVPSDTPNFFLSILDSNHKDAANALIAREI